MALRNSIPRTYTIYIKSQYATSAASIIHVNNNKYIFFFAQLCNKNEVFCKKNYFHFVDEKYFVTHVQCAHDTDGKTVVSHLRYLRVVPQIAAAAASFPECFQRVSSVASYSEFSATFDRESRLLTL